MIFQGPVEWHVLRQAWLLLADRLGQSPRAALKRSHSGTTSPTYPVSFGSWLSGLPRDALQRVQRTMVTEPWPPVCDPVCRPQGVPGKSGPSGAPVCLSGHCRYHILPSSAHPGPMAPAPARPFSDSSSAFFQDRPLSPNIPRRPCRTWTLISPHCL